MPPDKRTTPSSDKKLSIHGDVSGIVIVGDHNTARQTIIQKFFNIFKSDSETLEQRNRRILLNHVENAWIKGVLDASLHGAALLDLGIKQDPEAVTKYPWAIKKESTDETLPAGTSMLEIFDSIGLGRSLLILGAPGSGKTTMLLELTRGLIARAREDVTQPIPMVFNLASWTEKLTLADWLAQELNNLYSVPRKTAPDWVKGDKLLLLLDGLDEVRQESRAKCVEAINEFRKQNGLTSLSVCSRSQDYADLNAKLSFEGAIEVQPLTQEKIIEFFNRFGDETAGIKQVLKKDRTLREMAETPLFLSIMLIAYQNKRDVEILVSKDEKAQRKQLFDTYLKSMLQWRGSDNTYTAQQVADWLAWLAWRMAEHNQTVFYLEKMQPDWLPDDSLQQANAIVAVLSIMLISGLSIGLFGGLIGGPSPVIGVILGLVGGLFGGMFAGIKALGGEIKTVETISWSWSDIKKNLFGWLVFLMVGGLYGSIFGVALSGFKVGGDIETKTFPNQGLRASLQIAFSVMLVVGFYSCLLGGLAGFLAFIEGFTNVLIGSSTIGGLVISVVYRLGIGLGAGVGIGLYAGLFYGGAAYIQHFILRLFLYQSNSIPLNYVTFLDHCVDLIFLRRVGGGYIFIHRLLMEHFAEMYEKS